MHNYIFLLSCLVCISAVQAPVKVIRKETKKFTEFTLDDDSDLVMRKYKDKRIGIKYTISTYQWRVGERREVILQTFSDGCEEYNRMHLEYEKQSKNSNGKKNKNA